MVVRCGEIGSAAIAKVASNMLAFLNMAGGVECMALAKNAGLDLETFFDAIRASAGNSFAWETVMFRFKFLASILCDRTTVDLCNGTVFQKAIFDRKF